VQPYAMIESYLIARDRFMRKDKATGAAVGRMFPGAARVHCSLFGRVAGTLQFAVVKTQPV
jgi:hypothetical protein